MRTFGGYQPFDLLFDVFGADDGDGLTFDYQSAFAEYIRVDAARAFGVKPERFELIALQAAQRVAQRYLGAHVARRNVEREAFGLCHYLIGILAAAYRQDKDVASLERAERAPMRDHDVGRFQPARDENARFVQCVCQ